MRAIVGSHRAMTMEDIKGRALMKREEVDVIQLALPVYGANDTQVLTTCAKAVASLKKPGPDSAQCHSDGARGVDRKTSIAEQACRLPMNTASCH